MNTLAAEFANPSRAVLTTGSTPAFQYCLKNTGKKPAMTVVANTEFAQSYSAHESTGRLLNSSRTRPMSLPPGLPASIGKPEVRGATPAAGCRQGPACSGCIHSRSFDQRLRPDTALTAMAIALRWPTRTTRRLPRVTPVYSRLRRSMT